MRPSYKRSSPQRVPPKPIFADAMTDEEEQALRTSSRSCAQEHGDLDAAIAALEESPVRDQLQLTRLKKRKLQLKDQIARIEERCCRTSPLKRASRRSRFCAYIA